MRKLFSGIVLTLFGAATAINASAQQMDTTYYIQSYFTEAKTELKLDSTKDSVMQDYLLPTIAEQLRKNPYVTGVTFSSQPETSDETTYPAYVYKTRKSHVFVSLTLPARVTLLFEVNENYKVCRPTNATVTSCSGPQCRESGSGSSTAATCQLRSASSIKGPLSVYGTFANVRGRNVDQLLKNRQTLNFEVMKSSDLKNTIATTRLTLDSNLFDRGLAEFMEIFNVRTQEGSRFGALGGDFMGSVFGSRQMLLVGIARMERQLNEGMLK